jgi:hypothetical protein
MDSHQLRRMCSKRSDIASAINPQSLLLDCNCFCGDCHYALTALKLAATRMTAIFVVAIQEFERKLVILLIIGTTILWRLEKRRSSRSDIRPQLWIPKRCCRKDEPSQICSFNSACTKGIYYMNALQSLHSKCQRQKKRSSHAINAERLSIQKVKWMPIKLAFILWPAESKRWDSMHCLSIKLLLFTIT